VDVRVDAPAADSGRITSKRENDPLPQKTAHNQVEGRTRHRFKMRFLTIVNTADSSTPVLIRFMTNYGASFGCSCRSFRLLNVHFWFRVKQSWGPFTPHRVYAT
jgi:hypothetical protein